LGHGALPELALDYPQVLDAEGLEPHFNIHRMQTTRALEFGLDLGIHAELLEETRGGALIVPPVHDGILARRTAGVQWAG
jgi:hypothetical protein